METGFTHDFSCRAVQPDWLMGIQDHFCALCGPDTQERLCTGLCAPTPTSLCVSSTLIAENGLKGGGAHWGSSTSPLLGFSDLPGTKITSFRCVS